MCLHRGHSTIGPVAAGAPCGEREESSARQRCCHPAQLWCGTDSRRKGFVLAGTMQFRNSKGYYIFFALATIHKNTKGISSLFYFSAGLLLTQQPYLRILTLFTMAKFTCLYLQICYDFTDFHDKVHLSS